MTVACVGANVFIVGADLKRAGFVLANSAAVGLSPTTLPYLAALKGAGSVGLVIGLIGVTLLGLTAALALVMFYVGAVGAHIRASVLHNLAFPLVFLALAAGSAIYFALVMTARP
ncbi:DoxX family protein [Aeromicrobium phragmitis]|uniref:DoxX family protein n=1 Tax=Aeromicrobium phragmitis TaxID=2478914 RepID=UPI001AA0144F|nr:DoxX family protein [Aeromicrobium phragmitis]